MNLLQPQSLTRCTTLGVLCLLTFLLPACDKHITEPEANLQALSPANLDSNGGNWKTFVLTTATDVNIPAPAEVGSAAYTEELTKLKQIQSAVTDDQKQAVNYWSSGGVLRWNQLLRELVAKHNLPPQENADGTYPVPDANNPLAYPTFPFANPPYAARAYALVSVAQYDALVAAWHYKQQYKRKAPYQADASIRSLVPKSELPAYPSEDAVLASVTYEMLKALFPGEEPELKAKAEEQMNARLWAGANVNSDLEAGALIGKLVAQKVMARAKTDNTKDAIGNATIWQELADKATARGDVAWVSRETPKRPPMLPVFGKVKTWNFGPEEVVNLRPGPPPLASSAEMKKQLEEVKHYSENITREQWKIVSFWADGVGTYTPPGHWNAIATETISKQNWNELRTARAFALLNTAMMDAAVCCWDTKNFYFNARPSQLDPSIKTATGLPNFPSYTSGHSNFSGAAATVLSYLFPDQATHFNELAQEASMSRLYGAIHYRVDCEVGLQCGKNIAAFAVKRGQADGAK